MTRRMERINGLLRQEISSLLLTEVNDPRLSSIVSITQVDTSADLRNAKVFVSVLGTTSEKNTALDGLHSAAGFVHRSLRKNVGLKIVPTLHFKLDESIERGTEVLEAIKKISSDTTEVKKACLGKNLE